MKQLTLGSLFDGIGGWQLAAVRAGIKPIWSSEIETFPIEVTKRRFPNTKQLGDVTKLNGAEIEPVDIITSGSPCFVAGTLVHTEDGLKPIDLVCEDWSRRWKKNAMAIKPRIKTQVSCDEQKATVGAYAVALQRSLQR